jgi:hypothetical protein
MKQVAQVGKTSLSIIPEYLWVKFEDLIRNDKLAQKIAVGMLNDIEMNSRNTLVQRPDDGAKDIVDCFRKGQSTATVEELADSFKHKGLLGQKMGKLFLDFLDDMKDPMFTGKV